MAGKLVGFTCLDRVVVDPGTLESPVHPVPTDGLDHFVTVQLDVADLVWDDPLNADALIDITFQHSPDNGTTWLHLLSGNSIRGGARSSKDGSLPTFRIKVPAGSITRSQVACNKKLRIGLIGKVD